MPRSLPTPAWALLPAGVLRRLHRALRTLAIAVATAAATAMAMAVAAPALAAPGAGADAPDTPAAPAAPAAGEDIRTVVFAGGCFWCMEAPFDKLDGVLATTSGYAGGKVQRPTYDQVTHGNTGHLESVQVRYDAAKVRFEDLLDVYWHNIDPFDDAGQFCDKGSSYRAAIFVGDDAERAAAEASLQAVAAHFGQPVATRILSASRFWKAENYHQDFYSTNPVRYRYYRFGCRRDARLDELWGPSAGIGGPLVPAAAAPAGD